MKVFLTAGRDELGKFQGVVRAFPEIWDGLVLDVGCRSRNLKCALPDGKAHYCGVDLYPPADVLGDLEGDLPFGNGSFDTVVALDVLEHTDNIYKAFSELCRVTKRHLLISLPNAYEIRARVKFLFGQRLSGKYGLPPEPPDDRHRWVFSFREARNFVHRRREEHKFELVVEGSLVGHRRSFLIGRMAVSQFPNLLSRWYLALLHRSSRD